MSARLHADAVEVVDDLGDLVGRLAGRRVLVTGSTGLVGRSVVEALVEAASRTQGTSVLALARDAGRAARAFGGHVDAGRLTVVTGDVADAATLPDVDVVVHAASPATPSSFAADPVGVIDANVRGTANLLAAAARTGGYVALVSTMEVYGNVARTDPSVDLHLSEGDLGTVDPMQLRSAYPESKRMAENLCVAYAAQSGVRSDVVRLSHTYGPGVGAGDDRVQAQFLRAAVAGEDIVLHSDGSLRRTYTYVADAAAAILRIALTAPDRDAPVAYNVADEASVTSIRDLAATVLAAAGRPAGALRIELPEGDRPLWSTMPGGTFLDCSRLRALGWSAKVGLDEGMRRSVEFLREPAAAAV